MDEKGFGRQRTHQRCLADCQPLQRNAHAFCVQSRNMTDKHLDAIRESNGFVGVNFGTAFLRADGKKDPNATVEKIVHHIDYLLNKLVEDSVDFCSDFDGTTVPPALHDVAGLPLLVEALTRRGYTIAHFWKKSATATGYMYWKPLGVNNHRPKHRVAWILHGICLR
ncbi:MAG: membrane dipeptidase [Symbiopectobacterium sp.]